VIILLAVIAVTVIALALRLRAVERLPIDYDEDDYLRIGQLYASGLQRGDWSVFTRENYRTEHPPLHKIAYGLAIAGLPPAPEVPDLPTTADPAKALPQPHLSVARLTSALFGTLEVLALALLNPLAGLWLAVHTWTIKYTTQVMLEALPSLTSLLMVLAYLRARPGANQIALPTASSRLALKEDASVESLDRANVPAKGPRGWLALSAVMFGLTVAAKYPYGLAAVAVALHWLWQTQPGGKLTLRTAVEWVRPVALWAALALAVFFLANPYLWPDPINRLRDSVLYHGDYAQSEGVKRAGFPMWQPLGWLMLNVPWHPGVMVVMLDLLITLLAFVGLRRAWERQRLFVVWFGLVLGFLLVWSTKWPQYILMLTAPLCVLAAEGFQAVVWEPLTEWRSRRALRAAPAARWSELLRAAPWLLPGLAALIALVLFPLLYQVAVVLTDFNAMSLRDGISGGVWRAVWEGVTGQAKPVDFRPFSDEVRSLKVSYAGPGLLLDLISLGSDLFAFEMIWTVLVVAGQVALGVAVALLLARRGVPFRGWWRALFILPVAVPEFVGALIWANLTLPTSGWIALWLGQEMNWVASPDQSLLVLASGAVWMGWPLMMLAASAGLSLLPLEVYDAAALDGAGPWARFRHITWPMLWPLLAPAVIVRAIFAFNQFYLFYTFGWLTQGRIGLTTLAAESFFIFSPSFGGQFAVSAGVNIVIVTALVLFIVWFSRWSRAAEGVEYAA
jgi:ABC-type sugar transport system permease subunit